jgi:hypothetical protein
MNLSHLLFAYIDPGTGSIVLQMLIAGAVGIVVFFRNQINRVFQLFKPKKRSMPENCQTELSRAKK